VVRTFDAAEKLVMSPLSIAFVPLPEAAAPAYQASPGAPG
jgi:hypothetical protein